MGTFRVQITNLIPQGYSQHTEEDDPERIKQIVKRAKQDAKWVVEKVNNEIYILSS